MTDNTVYQARDQLSSLHFQTMHCYIDNGKTTVSIAFCPQLNLHNKIKLIWTCSQKNHLKSAGFWELLDVELHKDGEHHVCTFSFCFLSRFTTGPAYYY